MNTPRPDPPARELDLDPSGGHTLEALHVLSEISSNLADEDDLDELLGRFLGTMIRLAKADAGVVRVLTSDGEHLRMVASRGLPPQVVERSAWSRATAASAASPSARTSPVRDRPRRLRRAHPQRLLRHQLPGHGGGAAAERGACSAPTTCYLPQAFELPEEVALLFRSIGEHLGMALENARLKRENLRIVLTSERQMMAAEIHDSLAQTLAYMKMRMAMLTDAIATRAGQGAKYAGDVSQALDDAYGHLRELLVQFRSRMDPMGLEHSPCRASPSASASAPASLHYDNRLTDLRLEPEKESQVFHILQEALANVARHSGATEAI
jgi:two-component system nitrate/nitrite sensor histidine kinase NarX